MRHEIGELGGFDGVASIDVIAATTVKGVVRRARCVLSRCKYSGRAGDSPCLVHYHDGYVDGAYSRTCRFGQDRAQSDVKLVGS